MNHTILVVVETHTQTPKPQSIGNGLLKAEFLMTQKIRMHVRMNQLVQDGHPLRPRRPLQTLRAQGKSPLLGHITQLEHHVVGPGTARLCCSIVVFLVVTVLMFLFPFSLSVSCLCFRARFISGRSLCVSMCVSQESCGCFFFHEEKLKDKSAEGRGLNLGLQTSCVEACGGHTQTQSPATHTRTR